MTTEEKIIQYLRDNSLDITPYVDDYRHQITGTIVIVGIRMWGYGGCYNRWSQLLNILNRPGCPIHMESVESGPTERKYSFSRLVWNGV